MTGPSLPQDNLPLGERLARRWLDDWRGAAVLVAMLALASSITSLTNGFAYDDLPIVLENNRIHDWRRLWRLFGQTYWMLEHGPHDLYRPLLLVSLGVQWAVGAGSPMPFHVVNIFLYLVVAIAVLFLIRRFLSPRSAFIGAAVWAVHPVHVEAVANVVGQAELMVALAIVCGLNLYLRALARDGLGRRHLVLIVVCYAVALLSKEHALVFPILLIVVAMVRPLPVGVWSRSISSREWLLLRILCYQTALYLGIRWQVVGDFVGGPHHALRELGTSERLFAATGLWPEVARLMVWPAKLYADYSPQQVPVHRTMEWVHLLVGVAVIAWAVVVVRSWRARQRAVVLGLLWFPLTYALVSNVPFPTGVLVAERTLFLPSVAVGIVVGGWAESAARRSLGSRGFRAMLVFVLVGAGLGRSALRHPTWSDSATVFLTLLRDAPMNSRAHAALGETFLRLGAPERAGPLFRRAQELDPVHRIGYAGFLQGTGQCVEALRVLVANEMPEQSRVLGGLIQVSCLLERRQLRQARRLAADALLRGQFPANFARLRDAADSLLATVDSVDSNNFWLQRGQGFDRTDGVFSVVVRTQRRSGVNLVLGRR